MSPQIILTEDGNLGKAGDVVWVDDPAEDAKPAGKVAAKKTAAKRAAKTTE